MDVDDNMVAIVKKGTGRAQCRVNEIANIIYMECPLSYQDEWLKTIIEKGIWRPAIDE